MRLQLFFLLIIVYVISAFGWLTYSLVNFSNNEYKLQNQVLKAGRQACILKVIEMGKNAELEGEHNQVLFLKQIEMNADSNEIKHFLYHYNYASFEATFEKIGDNTFVNIDIAPAKRASLKSELDNKIRLYLYQSILLTILVAAGIYGVYYSVKTLYNLNKQQNNFLLSVTHEFKTPIAAMKLMLQTIRQRSQLPEDKRNELLDKAIENSNRLNELTENMLTAMKIENEHYNYSKELFSFSDMMNKVVEHYKIKNEITCDIEEGVDFEGDRFVLRISINNLVENAIKYSDNQPVHISMFRTDKKILVEVADLGIGIPDSQKNHVFKRFYRVQDEEIRSTKGTGLGLFIASQTIKKHNGSIKVRDNHPKGTVMKVSLPIS